MSDRSAVYNGTIIFHGDKSITSGYRPKVFLRESSVESREIPKDVSVRQSPVVFSLMGLSHAHSLRSPFYVESAPKIKSRDSFFIQPIHLSLEETQM